MTMNTTPEPFFDELREALSEAQSGELGAVAPSQGFWNPPAPLTCPSCGRCPTCGRGGYFGPYVPYDHPTPWGGQRVWCGGSDAVATWG